MPARARTFLDDQTIEVEVLTAPTATGLCKVDYNGKTLVRHKDRLVPINKEARELLGHG